MKTKFILLTILIFGNIIIYGNKIDVSQFDIAGVKLGMSPKEVREKIKLTYNVDEKDIEEFYHHSYEGQEKYLHSLKLKMKNMQLIVIFCCIPNGKNLLLKAENIHYKIASTRKNSEKMYLKALSKYGQYTTYDITGFIWCEHTKLAKYGCKLDKPLLRQSGTSIVLQSTEYLEFKSKVLEKRKIITPKF